MMKLVLGWALVGAFVFTLVVTCLSLVGWVKFQDPEQQKKLFQVLVVEIVVGVGAAFLGALNFDPEPVKRELEDRGTNRAVSEVLRIVTEDDVTVVDRSVLSDILDRMRVEHDPGAAAWQRDLRAALPEGPTFDEPGRDGFRLLNERAREQVQGLDLRPR